MAIRNEIIDELLAGKDQKTVLTDTKPVELSIPRDRKGTFEPQLISTVADAVLEEVAAGRTGRWMRCMPWCSSTPLG